MTQPYVRAAADWLVAHQNADGGWGETCASYMDDSLRGRGPSTASQTGWALLALVAANNKTYERAIRRGTGEEEGVTYDEVTYEAYGPGGVGVMIEALTDNKNRTVGEIRHICGKWGGKLAEPNSVMRMFHKKGLIVVEKAAASEEALMDAVLDAGADDMKDDGAAWEVLTAPDAYGAVLEKVRGLGIEPASAAIAMLPSDYIKLEGKPAQQMLKLMEALEDHDDTKHVWSNFDVEEQEIEASLA